MSAKESPMVGALKAAWADPEWRANQVKVVKAGIRARIAEGKPWGRPKKVAVKQKEPT